MTAIEYLSLPWYKRILYRIIALLVSIPKAIFGFFKVKLPNFFVGLYHKFIGVFKNIFRFAVDGDWKTRVSFLVMGFGMILRKFYLKGILVLIYQIAFIYFTITTGIPTLIRIGSFGFVAQTSYIHPDLGLPITVTNDNSFMLLLNMIIFIILAGIFLFLWYAQLNDSINLQNLNSIGKKKTSKELVKSLVGKNYHLLLLAFPTAGLIIFTIVPLIFMILVAFTNYSSSYQSPKELFDWVGVYNFKKLFGMGSNSYEFSYVFGQVLLWTLIWAFFATFTNYFLGMIVAIIINRKGIKGKKVWRTILITTIAVPQFISLLFLSKFLNKDQGALNFMLKSMGLITQNIPFLEDALMGKITIIIVNMWIGIPYTMLMCSGLLMNIPQDLYESAKIDGASPFKVYTKITLPYMLFVTGPYLISSFVGNINNFNVIFLLSGGGPIFTNVNGAPIVGNVYGAGQTDLLITWLYKMAMQQVNKNYGLASVIGLCIFIIIGGLSLITYSRTNAVKNEGDFQ